MRIATDLATLAEEIRPLVTRELAELRTQLPTLSHEAMVSIEEHASNGTLTWSLSVIRSKASDEVSVSVNMQPAAIAGTDLTADVCLEASVLLDGDALLEIDIDDAADTPTRGAPNAELFLAKFFRAAPQVLTAAVHQLLTSLDSDSSSGDSDK